MHAVSKFVNRQWLFRSAALMVVLAPVALVTACAEPPPPPAPAPVVVSPPPAPAPVPPARG